MLSILSAGPSLMAQNLVPNPDLSDGIFHPFGWGFNTPEGNRAERLLSADGAHSSVLLTGSGRDWAGLSSTRVPVTPGETLTVGALLRNEGGTRGEERDRLFVRFYTNGFAGQDGPSLGGLTSDWQAIVGTVTAPVGATSADVSLQIRSAAAIQIAYPLLLRGSQLPQAREQLSAQSLPATGWRVVHPADLLPADANANGLPDSLEKALGVPDGARSARLTRRKTTSFQTPTGYREDNDLKVDRIIIAGNDETAIGSWAQMGYEPQVMVGFRAGDEYLDQTHGDILGRDEVQTDSQGELLTCGPGSYYMVPTENRRRIFSQYFADAVRRGARAACPEEPEFFSRAGYSPAFKREWQAFYGEPWQDQAGSVAARYRSDRLKVTLERKLLQACYEGARSADPQVQRYLLAHSPLSYTAWGIVFGHHDMIATGEVDAMIAQVWTGTARSAVNYEGRRRERTFENAFLEYASCVGLVRQLPIDLWFLMDPVEDNPDRAMEDYHDNYERTLAAALMFPDVCNYETMPWPTRIFGRVPAEFATEICSVVSVLSDMQSQTEVRTDRGPEGIGMFLADSAMWQRGAPHQSDLDCFYGVTLPLLMRGIPVEVPHLDRAADPGYLDRYKLLFVSYDFLKPMRPEINEALARWARNGGCLVVLGGEDPYNAVPSWWQDKGFTSPQDHLLSLCGLDVSQRRVGGRGPDTWKVVAQTPYTGRNLENATVERIDLTPFLAEGAALVRFEDSKKDDGWGALIRKLTVTGSRNGRPVKLSITPGTPEEQRAIAIDDRSSLNPEGFRFCDADTSVTYRFDLDPGTVGTLEVDIGNQYLVSACGHPNAVLQRFEARKAQALGVSAVEFPAALPVVHYEGSGADALYAGESGTLLSEKALGKGCVLFFGAPASWFARSEAGAAQVRALARYAMEVKHGTDYAEKGYMRLDRGSYTVAKTFDEGHRLSGRWVNVLDAGLPVVTTVDLAPDRLAVLRDVSSDMTGQPKLLFSSSCVEWKDESSGRLRAIISGAAGTTGACRIFTGERKVRGITMARVDGHELPVEQTQEADTLLLRFANQPFGVALDIEWE